MTTNAKIGFGITFGRETATPGTYASLGEVIDVTPPAMTREVVDATHHGSTNRVREKIAGMRDAGEAEVVMNYDPGNTTWDDLKTDFDSDTPKNYKITFPDSETVTISALVTELAVISPINDKMTLRAKFALTGAGTWS